MRPEAQACRIPLRMFDGRAFRSWGDVLIGAFVLAGLFLGIMIMTEEVVGGGARLSRAAIAVTLAAFIGYLGTAWIVRREMSSER